MTDRPSTLQTQVEHDQARIQAEMASLEASTDPFVSAVRATRMPMIITSPRLPDNPVIFVNNSFCRLTGYARHEILGRNCRFLQGPETDPDTVRQIREAVARAEAIEIDIRNHRKDGTPFWNRLLSAPVRDASGEVAYFFASQVDVTLERERLAGLESHNAALLAALGDRLRSLEESESRLRFATEAGGLGIWELDLPTGTLSTSVLCKAHFGRAPEAPLGEESFRRAIHPEDRPAVEAAIAESVATGRDYAVECRVVRPDGGIGWVAMRAQLVRAIDGTPLRLAGTTHDITRRRQAERHDHALLELDDRIRALETPGDLAFAAAEILGRTLDVTRAGYGTIDPQAETITIERDWTAPGVASLSGTLRFRDYGDYFEELKRGETVVIADANADPRTDAAAMRAIGAIAVINMPITEAGRVVALFYLGHPTPREWLPEELAFVREVSQRARMAVARRRAEQDLRALAGELESQVAARTQALMEAEAALRQSQKMEAVGQLTGGIAHDFNNLLTGISGSLELIRARIAQGRLPEVDRYLNAARGASNRAAALTHRLLAFSRQQALDPRPTSMNRLVAGLEELIRRTVGPAITVEVVGAAGLWTTMVDPGQLENALLNLCINARDAMPEGGRLTIETANARLDRPAAALRELAPGHYVALSVSDTGTGMTEEVIAKAFDPFFTTKPLGQGTGLGLSMIYGFARQSGGQVRIYSELGQGTTMRIYLPRHLGEAEAAEAAEAPAAAPPRARQGETVLVVDDEAPIRMLVADLLGDLGYVAIEAEHAAAGLDILRSGARVDLLVTDVGLPGGMNGRQLADAARALRPGLKALFITGYAENAVVGHCHLEPGMAMLSKPFTMEALASRIREMIQGP